MIPMELITMIGSGLLAAVMSLWSMSIKAKQAQHQMMIERLGAERAAVDDARRYSNEGYSFTRRTLAIMSVFSVIVLPKLAVFVWPEVPVMVGYTEFHPGFWFFTDGHEVVKWQTARGFALTPLDTHFVSAVAGLYFGASVVKNA